jgi:molybdopterin/thiamine biosynthesis adenylyltransferase
MSSERYERQERFFGEEGQAKLAAVKVIINGAGGLCAPLAQQLAYLGVRQFALVDMDRLGKTSLNRLIGAFPSDLVEPYPYKVDIIKRMILTIAPDAVVKTLPMSLLTVDAFDEVKGADYVFGCVDLEGVRLVLSQLCAAYAKPYFDLASEILADQPPIEYGGRVFFASRGEGCLKCADELDMDEARRDFMSPQERKIHEKIYGLPVTQLEDSGPSVVTLNSVIASLAATEFMVEVTGVRPANRLLTYRGSMGIVSKKQIAKEKDCALCATWNTREAAGVERYLHIKMAA